MNFGYCTNVHAGTTLEAVRQNLETYSRPIQQQVCPGQALPVGLWLSHDVAEELESSGEVDKFGAWLHERQLTPYTLNGFPFADFHQPVVKQNVYRPTWASEPRLDYTLRLARLLDRWLPPGQRGTISTLPLAWPCEPKRRQAASWEQRFGAADQSVLIASACSLSQLAAELHELEQATGRWIQICLEPEPGCLIDCADDLVQFYEQCLLRPQSWNRDDPLAAVRPEQREMIIRRSIAVCHDVCHSAVMFEPQAVAIARYRDAGIAVGKIQISAAVEAAFSTDPQTNAQVRQSLSGFAEPKYLHQTAIAGGPPADIPTSAIDCQYRRFFEDLPGAMAALDADEDWATGGSSGSPATWRVHFHVPIFLPDLGSLRTTQSEILACLAAVQQTASAGPPPHLEIETYAWNVLPTTVRQELGLEEDPLVPGIAHELTWLQDQLTNAAAD